MYTLNDCLVTCEKSCYLTAHGTQSKHSSAYQSDGHYSGENDETIASLFLTIAASKGNAPAIVQMNEKLNTPNVLPYSQLYNQVQMLAHRLVVDYDIKVGDVVCQCMERSFDMVIGLLAILMAGGVYCPLNSTDPEERISALIESTHARLVLLHNSTEHVLQHVNKSIDKFIFNYKDYSSKQNQTKYSSLLHSRAIPSGIAYIIFTSGSTGKPKGVPISHVNFLTHWRSIHQSLNDEKPLRSNDEITLSMGSATFDISLNEILSSLLLGGHFIMLQPRGHLDASHIVDTIESQNITQLFVVPSALRPLLDFVEEQQCSQRLKSLRSVWCGGEPVPGQLASQFYQILSSSSVEFVNAYGPTECSILATYHRVTKADIDRDVLPIGRSLPNYSCCILTENFVPVQQGSVGELFISGKSVFGGYLINGNNEDVDRLNSLNARVLVDIPSLQSSSNKNGHKKFYRTGDLCRLNDDGEIVFVGRVDHQVKLRGQRLELGEIEACILAVPLVTYCVTVKCRHQVNQHEFLVAYVQCPVSTQTSLSIKEAIQQRCRTHLPAYMVPTVVVLMDKLPLNANGKVDRNQLPVPEIDTQFDSKYVENREPSSELEHTIRAHWISVLGIDHISMSANFFSLGGNSLLLMRLFGIYRSTGLIKSKTISIDPFFTQTMLIEHVRLLEQENAALSNVDQMKMTNDDIWLPLGVDKAIASAAQQRIWLDEQLRYAKSSKTAMYNVAIPIVVGSNSSNENKSCIELSRLRRALLSLIRRHKVLRTRIRLELNVITQYVNPMLDQCTLEQHEQFYSFVESVCSNDDQLQQVLADEVLNHVFHINEGLIVRFHLIRRSAEHIGRDQLTSGDVIVFNIHHAAIDGESKSLFLSDLQRVYDDELTFGKQDGEDLFQYIDFSIHESRLFEADTESSLLTEARAYWQQSLDGCLDKHLSLCQNPPRMNMDDGHGNYLFDLEMDLVDDFVSLAAVHNLSLYQMYLAAYVLFLHKMTGDRDICVGGVTANRYRPEQRDLIGMFVNLLPYRIKFDNTDDDLQSYYGYVRQVCLDFMRYGLLPLQEIVKLHRTSHDQLETSPFFQTTLAFYSNTAASHLGTYSFDGVPCESISLPVSVVKFDLCLVVNHTLTDDNKGNNGRGQHRMLCKWEYSTRLYDVNEIQILATRFKSFLASLIDAKKMTQMTVLIPNDFKVFRQLNDTQSDLSHSISDPSIINHFEMHVCNQPDKIALICNGVRFTYDQIDKQAIQLAAHLIESCGVRQGDAIMQCVNRGIEMVVGILAILKAEAIYCPLNPADPSHRHFSLINDISASVVLCDRTTEAAFQAITANVESQYDSLILVNTTEVLHSTTLTTRTLRQQQSVTTANDIAYIVYTSGSTGQPKAVPISHENFMTCIRGMQHLKMIDSSDIVAQITECTYDVHLMELLGCLVTGGTLVMLKQHGNMDMSYLANTISKYNVTWVILVPTLALSLYEQLTTSVEHRDKLQSLKTWVSGGEPMIASTVGKLLPYFAADVQVYNVYGPAEASMATTVHRVQPKDANAKFVPIGRPLPNYSCHIFDKDLCPMPVGCVGELFIGGPAVFGGYRGAGDADNDRLKSLNNSALVNIPSFQYQSNKNGHNKFYRTGDLCRLNDDGEIVFVGRVDHQVKLRGQRVELGEIETCIRTANSEIKVRNCIVVKCIDELTRQEYLIAYVEPAYGTPTENYNIIQMGLSKACMQRLPAHMVPSSWLLLESFPLNANNKIDHKQLPPVPLRTTKIRRKSARQLSINYDGHLEDILSEIFSSALNVDLDNDQHYMSFIELGGSSINAITMVNLIREQLYAEMEIHLLFKNPTISALAKVLQSKVIKLSTSDDNDLNSENDVMVQLFERV